MEFLEIWVILEFLDSLEKMVCLVHLGSQERRDCRDWDFKGHRDIQALMDWMGFQDLKGIRDSPGYRADQDSKVSLGSKALKVTLVQEGLRAVRDHLDLREVGCQADRASQDHVDHPAR